MKVKIVNEGESIDFNKINILQHKQTGDIVLSQIMHEDEFLQLNEKGKFRGITISNGDNSNLRYIYFKTLNIEDFILMPGEIILKND